MVDRVPKCSGYSSEYFDACGYSDDYCCGCEVGSCVYVYSHGEHVMGSYNKSKDSDSYYSVNYT